MKYSDINNFRNLVAEVNEKYRNGLFEIISFLKGKVIVETEYGKLITTKNRLMRGDAPSIISAINKTEYWENRAKKVHNNFYAYLGEDYKSNNDKIKIICPIHGEFIMNRNNHLNGSGCSKCGKERAVINMIPTGWGLTNWVKSASVSREFDSFKLYVVKLFDENESFFKIGRTFRTCKRRFDSIPYNFEVVFIINSSAYDIFNLESFLKNSHLQFKYKPLKRFQGKDECFTLVDLNYISYQENN